MAGPREVWGVGLAAGVVEAEQVQPVTVGARLPSQVFLPTWAGAMAAQQPSMAAPDRMQTLALLVCFHPCAMPCFRWGVLVHRVEVAEATAVTPGATAAPEGETSTLRPLPF